MTIERNMDGTNYATDFSKADEIHCYNNGDGTFTLEIEAWVRDREGNKKHATFTMPRAILGQIELLMDNGSLFTYKVDK